MDDLVAPSVFSGRYMAKNLKANGCDVEVRAVVFSKEFRMWLPNVLTTGSLPLLLCT